MSDAENPHGNNEYSTAPSKIIGKIWFSDIFCLRNPRYNIGNRQVAAIKYLKKAREMGSVSKIIKSFCVIKEVFNPRLLIKTDDDCCLNLFRLFGSSSLNIEPIIDSLKSHHYCGSLGNYPESYKSEWNGASNHSKYIGPYMNGGMGYTLSPEALDFICNFPSLERRLSLEI